MVNALPDHIGLPPGAASAAILCGDPERAHAVADRLGARKISARRGFDIYVTDQSETSLAVVSTGIGGPATALVAEELIMQGVRVLVRLGSCGSLCDTVRPGDVVISTGCVRADGVSATYLGASIPAAPHFQLTSLLAEEAAAAARVHARQSHAGLTHCKDVYYSEKIDFHPDEDAARRQWSASRRAGALATEMEAAALFAVAQVRGAAAGCALIVVGKTTGAAEAAGFETGFNAVTNAVTRFVKSPGFEQLRVRPLDPTRSFLRPGALETPTPRVEPKSD